MRVRPFFWFLLFFSCVGILVFAATNQMHAPARLQVHVDQQHLTAQQLTTLELDLPDPQGVPIEDSQVLSDAHMTNMDMSAYTRHIAVQRQGKYPVQIHLAMPGRWAVVVHAHGSGFTP